MDDLPLPDDLGQIFTWLLPLLFGLLSWLAVQVREKPWARNLVRSIGLTRTEHEQDWEYRRRLGTFWLTIASILGLFSYVMIRHVLQHEQEAPTWEFVALLCGALLLLWSVANSLRAYWASRRRY